MKRFLMFAGVALSLGCGEQAFEPATTRSQTVDCVSTTNVRIENVNQAATLAREACDVIEADVFVTGNESIAFSSGVTEIRGTLYLVDFTGDELQLFDQLRSVSKLRVRRSVMGTLEFPALQAASSIRIDDSEIGGVYFDSLATIDTLTLMRSSELATLSLPNLETAGRLHLYDLPGLRSVSTDLTGVASDVVLERVGLESMSGFEGLSTVGGTLSIARNISLQDIGGLSSVTSVGNTLGLAQNPLLGQIDAFDEMNSHDDFVAITDMPGLSQITGLLAIQHMRELELSRLPLLDVNPGFTQLLSLNRLRLDTLRPVWTASDLGIDVEIAHLTIANVETFTTLDGLRLASNGSLYAVANNSLTDVSGLGTPTSLDVVYTYANDTPRLGWQNVTTINELRILNDADVVAVGLPALTRIAEDLELVSLPNLNDNLELDQLAFVGDDFELRVTGTTNPSLPALKIVDDDLLIRYNNQLDSLNGIDLDRVGDSAIIRFNPVLAPCAVDEFLARIEDGPATITRSNNDGTGPCN